MEVSIPYRILVIDDGSADNTWEVILTIRGRYPEKIVAVKKPNGGVSSARNNGLNMIQDCKYVGFVDGDDYVDKNYLDELVKALEEQDSDISMCASNRCYGNNGEGKRFSSGFNDDFTTNDIEWVLCKTSFVPWNKLFKFRIWQELRFQDGITYEDFATIPQAM